MELGVASWRACMRNLSGGSELDTCLMMETHYVVVLQALA